MNQVENRILMLQYIKLTDFWGKVLGKDYEIVLHDLSDPEHSIIAIANNDISGRQVGGPLTNIALQLISNKSYLNANFLMHYDSKSPDGKKLISHTFFIKNSQDELIGLLCINHDPSRYIQMRNLIAEVLQPDWFNHSNFQYNTNVAEDYKQVTQNAAPQSGGKVETFHNTSQELTKEIAVDVLQSMNIRPGATMSGDEKYHFIKRMYDQGVFLVKGSVKDVMEVINCSQATVYRYLSEIKSEEEQQPASDE
ncbi:MAG: PAS domain-containing protein [Peptoniphilaceae bacterium]|nr:PAS domain-containing protein [Peptoniphilaceae bacterium]MDY6085845.1 PAS domain-containing protein [Peptoniphilaceae bacterium]